MRPDSLFSLFEPLENLKGVGPATAEKLARLCGGPRVLHLLLHIPYDLMDRRIGASIAEAAAGGLFTQEVEAVSHYPPPRGRMPWRVVVTDGSDQLDILFFYAYETWIKQRLPLGKRVLISGRLDILRHRKTMAHPDYILPVDKKGTLRPWEPKYRLSQDLNQKNLRKYIAEALGRLPENLKEWIPQSLMEKYRFPPFKEALQSLHCPEHKEALNPAGPALSRLAFDELLADQSGLLSLRETMRRTDPGRAFSCRKTLLGPLMEALPFRLTAAQMRVFEEISQDMAAPKRCLRLLQGDVGSGKTIIALLCMLQAVENGAQAALIAPTDILAAQHKKTFDRFLDGLGVTVGLLKAAQPTEEKKQTLAAIESGACSIVVGTHALFQSRVRFADLGLCIIDEQHRFGVHQRELFQKKGTAADFIVMTATPIPRTLSMALYGDLDISVLRERLPSRQRIETRLLPASKIKELMDRLKAPLSEDQKVYWICPHVEEGDENVGSVQKRFKALQKAFPSQKLLMLHGKMKEAEKTKTMEAFLAPGGGILAASTVAEVGLDIPEATVIVIEDAQLFGLAQLHQLRGRVGRSTQKSYCILLYTPPLSAVAQKRLEVMRSTEDGFLLAEEDLKLRGQGEILGTRQSGLPTYRFASLSHHLELLREAHTSAKHMEGAEHKEALRILLQIFEKDFSSLAV